MIPTSAGVKHLGRFPRGDEDGQRRLVVSGRYAADEFADEAPLGLKIAKFDAGHTIVIRKPDKLIVRSRPKPAQTGPEDIQRVAAGQIDDRSMQFAVDNRCGGGCRGGVVSGAVVGETVVAGVTVEGAVASGD